MTTINQLLDRIISDAVTIRGLRAEVESWKEATKCDRPEEVAGLASGLVRERDGARLEAARLKDEHRFRGEELEKIERRRRAIAALLGDKSLDWDGVYERVASAATAPGIDAARLADAWTRECLGTDGPLPPPEERMRRALATVAATPAPGPRFIVVPRDEVKGRPADHRTSLERARGFADQFNRNPGMFVPDRPGYDPAPDGADWAIVDTAGDNHQQPAMADRQD